MRCCQLPRSGSPIESSIFVIPISGLSVYAYIVCRSLGVAVKVVVFSGQRLVAQAMGALLVEVMGFELLAICDQLCCALEAVRRGAPDLMVLDPLGWGADWIPVVDAFLRANPSGRLVVLNDDGTALEPHPALLQCTIAVLDSRSGWPELITVLAHLQQRLEAPLEACLPVGCLAVLLGMDRLPQRERRLLMELGQGLQNKQIAHKLGLTPATVSTYRKTIAAKLGLSGAELVRSAALYRCWTWASSIGSMPGC